jgi:ComF family protein
MNSVDGWLRRARSHLLPIVWSPRCILCGGPGQGPDQDLCRECEADLPRNDHCCSVCAEILQGGAADLICGACVRKTPRFDIGLAPYRYAYPLDHLVRRLKYSGEVVNGRVLAEVFVRAVASNRIRQWPQLLLPVPLGDARFRRRGYNQALELATHVSRRLQIPLDSGTLIRTRETLEQAGLDRRARRKNLRGAFAIRRELNARHVAIMDDVVTTGSTANEIARVLKRAGVETIEVWAIARAGRQ